MKRKIFRLAFLILLVVNLYAEAQMSLKNCSLMTTTTPAGRGNQDERLIAVNIETKGAENPLILTAIKFSLPGTTDIADITKLKVWFSKDPLKFLPSDFLGSVVPAGGEITVNVHRVLGEGSNFLWITADISDSAKEGNYLRGTIDSVLLNGDWHRVVPSSIPGKRLILPEHILLFTGGDYGSKNFRIPAIKTAADGSLVVAADARINGPGDLPADIDIMIRRSTDLGQSWSEAITIADFGKSGASDPALVADIKTGNLLCMFASHQGLFQSTPDNPIRFRVCTSRDNGVTWSAPADHTSEIYLPGWHAAWLASGSAHQLRSGKIVGTIGVRLTSGPAISNFMICSDDGGKSWYVRSNAASPTGNEAKIVELDNGNLMMNIRNEQPHCRKITESPDQGKTWGTPCYAHELTDPFVNGDFIRYTSVLDGYEKSRLLFSIAADSSRRQNLTVFLSYDEGKTWGISKVINPGPSGYSSLTVLPDGTIGCFYENGEHEQYQLYFARFSLEWLTGGKDRFTGRGGKY